MPVSPRHRNRKRRFSLSALRHTSDDKEEEEVDEEDDFDDLVPLGQVDSAAGEDSDMASPRLSLDILSEGERPLSGAQKPTTTTTTTEEKEEEDEVEGGIGGDEGGEECLSFDQMDRLASLLNQPAFQLQYVVTSNTFRARTKAVNCVDLGFQFTISQASLALKRHKKRESISVRVCSLRVY